MALPVPDLHAGHHAVERGEGLLHLQPAVAPASRGVGAGRVLDHEPLVPAGAGLGEEPLEVVGRGRGRQAAQREPSRGRREEIEALEARPPLAQGYLEEQFHRAVARSEGQHVEGDEGHGDLRQHHGRRCLPAQPLLERKERQDDTLAHGQQLTVQDAVPRQAPGGLQDLRELPGHVVEIAREEAYVVALPVQLGADAVVLVLGPDLRPEAGDDLGSVLGGRREHEAQRMEQAQARGGQAVVPGQARGLADVAGQHHGTRNVGGRPAE